MPLPSRRIPLQTGLDFHTTTDACLAEQICKLWSFQVQIHYWPPQSIFRNSPEMQQIHYRPLQWVFRNNPEMHINSLPTTTISLQIQPRDTHKSPPKSFLGNSKVSHLLQLGLRFVKVRALQALLETQTHTHIRSLLQFESEHQLTQCFSFQSQNVICKEVGTLHLLRWKRKMSQQSCPSLLLYISLMTCIHSTWQNVMKLKFENSSWLSWWLLSFSDDLSKKMQNGRKYNSSQPGNNCNRTVFPQAVSPWTKHCQDSQGKNKRSEVQLLLAWRKQHW